MASSPVTSQIPSSFYSTRKEVICKTTGVDEATQNLILAYLAPSVEVRLWESRPQEVLEKGKMRLDYAKTEKYTYVGAAEYEVTFNGWKLTSTQIVTTLFQQHPRHTPFNLLDVGAGNNDFIQGVKKQGKAAGITVTGYAVSASDMRRFNFRQEENYQVWNAEEVLTNPVLRGKKYQLITCITTCHCLTDTLGTLAQLYSMLEPGGILLADDIACYGLQERFEPWVAYLNEVGYQIVAGYDRSTQLHTAPAPQGKRKLLPRVGWLSFLLIQKTHPELNWEIGYNPEQFWPAGEFRHRALYHHGIPQTASEMERSKAVILASLEVPIFTSPWKHEHVLMKPETISPLLNALIKN